MSPRHVKVIALVVSFHAILLWALQQGLLRRTAEMLVPAQIIATLLEASTSSKPAPTPTPTKAIAKPSPASQPAPVPQQEPVPAAPTAQAAPAMPAAANSPALPSGSPGKTSTPTSAIELPSSEAQYLNNTPPTYPAISKRLGEQGKVIVRVLIGADGLPREAQLVRSSGHDRLDKVAIDTVLKWRYVPGRQGGVAQTMWYQIPIIFELK
jgi:periplasmic protein TonB